MRRERTPRDDENGQRGEPSGPDRDDTEDGDGERTAGSHDRPPARCDRGVQDGGSPASRHEGARDAAEQRRVRGLVQPEPKTR